MPNSDITRFCYNERNEIGIFFGIKFVVKAIFFRERLNYTLREFFMQILGKSEFVERNEHKGFNYKYLRKILEQDFLIDLESGIPFRRLPQFFNSQIGWVMFPKSNLDRLQD